MYANITKDNIDLILKDLAKIYTQNGHNKMDAEIVLVGGAAILANYSFRESSGDVDAMIFATSAMDDAILKVRDKYNLQPDWLNADFAHTRSFSDKLLEHSGYYKTFSNFVKIRTVEPEYLVAMKLNAFREYKHDKSDIIGILAEQEEMGSPISKEGVQNAYMELYHSKLPVGPKGFLDMVFAYENKKELLKQISVQEKENLQKLKDFQEEHPAVLNGNNLKEILKNLSGKESLSEKNNISKEIAQDEGR